MLSHGVVLSPNYLQMKGATPHLCHYFNVYIRVEITCEAESNRSTEKPLARANPEKKKPKKKNHVKTLLGASFFSGLSRATQTNTSIMLQTHCSVVSLGNGYLQTCSLHLGVFRYSTAVKS